MKELVYIKCVEGRMGGGGVGERVGIRCVEGRMGGGGGG